MPPENATAPVPSNNPTPVRGTITIAIEGGPCAVYAFEATPFQYAHSTVTVRVPTSVIGWRVRGTFNGKALPTEHTTHDANPLVAVRQWYAKIVGGGG